jgi:hypothetical protein
LTALSLGTRSICCIAVALLHMPMLEVKTIPKKLLFFWCFFCQYRHVAHITPEK